MANKAQDIAGKLQISKPKAVMANKAQDISGKLQISKPKAVMTNKEQDIASSNTASQIVMSKKGTRHRVKLP